MHDIKWIRDNPEALQTGLKAKGVSFDADELLDWDRLKRECITEVEGLKAKRNQANQDIAKLKKAGEQTEGLLEEMKSISQNIKKIDEKVGELDKKITNIIYSIPNLPHSSVPVAPGDEGNQVVRSWGDPRELDFEGKDHLDLANQLGWLDMERGSKISGSGFAVYQGKGAKLERALINFMIDFHVKHHGFKEIWPPTLVNSETMTGTGQLPKMEGDMYRLSEDDLYLIPTAEVPVTNLHRAETLQEKDLPIRYVAYTPCFRREAGAYGKDTRGLSRLHEFDKVEMVQFVRPEESLDTLETLTGYAEAILQALELPYRVVLLGSGDLSFAAWKCYDLEVWAPVSQKWFEVSSCSTFGDFQARRMNIRFKRNTDGKPEFVHTLNGSGVALARTVLCLLENFQTASGEVVFPEALRPYIEN